MNWFKTHYLGEVDIPDDARDMVFDALRANFSKLAPIAAVHSLLTSLVLMCAFWGDTIMSLVFVWCYAGATFAFLNLRTTAEAQNGHPDRQGRLLIRNVIASGLIWGGILAALLAASSDKDAILLGVLSAGVMCMGAFLHSPYPVASLGYSVAVGGGVLGGLVLGGWNYVPELTALVASFMFALQRFAAYNRANFVRRFLADRDLRKSRETVGLLLCEFESNSADWLWETDEDGCIVNASNRFVEVSGIAREALEGTPLHALFSPESERSLREHILDRRSFRDLVLEVTSGGPIRWWSLNGQPLPNGGYRGVGSDITRARDAEAKIAFHTHYDPVTELPNRTLLLKELDSALARVPTGETCALLCVDVDNFRGINDSFGHAVGDAFLKIVGERLKASVERDDIVARLGGDEFAVLLRYEDPSEVEERADLIVDALLAAVRLQGREILSGGSVGIALAPQHGDTGVNLLKHAEIALYRAKTDGRGCWRYFEPSMDVEAQRRAELENDLRAALANDSMNLYFQPLVDARTHQVRGYETLLRWNRAGHGLVAPGVFIGLAEDTGIIVPLGEWVIRKAIAEAASWRDPVTVAINLSPAQLKTQSIVATVISALATTQLDPSRLEIEITESVLMEECDQNLKTLHALRSLGVRIALDDFGTGYSSLNYLRAFPFDKIKIDKCFVKDIQTSADSQAIVRAVITLARELGMDVTVEGVETREQAEILAAMHCTHIQGYLFGRPAPSQDVPRLPERASTAQVAGFHDGVLRLKRA